MIGSVAAERERYIPTSFPTTWRQNAHASLKHKPDFRFVAGGLLSSTRRYALIAKASLLRRIQGAGAKDAVLFGKVPLCCSTLLGSLGTQLR